VTYVIAQPCVDVLTGHASKSARWTCIYEGERMLYIHPDECVDCGACEPCARSRLSTTKTTFRTVEGLLQVNVDFFEDLGSRAVRRKTGRLARTTRWWRRCPQGEAN